MGIIEKVIGPKSKYDKSLPYTYMARTPMIEGSDMYEYYFGHTICSLVEYLNERKIAPRAVEMFGIYRKEEIPLDLSLVTNKKGHWLRRPAICHSLEAHYRNTQEEIYKGHHESEPCCFDDRKLKGYGPY